VSEGELWYDGDDAYVIDYDNDDRKCKVENLTAFIISGAIMSYKQFLGNIALTTANWQAFIILSHKDLRVYSTRVFNFIY
jgi:hypothetical protein